MLNMKTPSIPFEGFPKMARLNREIIVTEKIDGTNAQIFIPDAPVCVCGHESFGHYQGEPCFARPGPTDRMCDCKKYEPAIYAGSRTQWITPEKDNHGFAKWVQANKAELLKLGPGQHFGEWWGSGIQRGYGLVKGEKRFSLFNVSRWGDDATRPPCCHVVPTLWRGNMEEFLGQNKVFGFSQIDLLLQTLRNQGSFAAPGFMRPEGIVVFHTAGGHLFKKTLEKDESPKSLVE